MFKMQHLTLDVLCTELYPKSDKNVNNTDKKFFAPFSKIQLPVHDFRRHSLTLDVLCTELYPNSDKNVDNTDKNFFAPVQ
jgi:hypothetical protein